MRDPSSLGFTTWFTGASDFAADEITFVGRGAGQPIKLDFAGPGTQSVKLRFSEVVELHDGEANWSPCAVESAARGNATVWTAEDTFSISMQMAATATTPNGGGTGNCDLIPIGGGRNIIVPAPGTGTHDVDLAAAVPVAAWNQDQRNGYWDLNRYTGALTASVTPGEANWHLFDFATEGFLVKNVPMIASDGQFEVNTYRAERIHPNHRIVLTVTKVTAGAGVFAGWLEAFRADVT
jgi:hypothetical protein